MPTPIRTDRYRIMVFAKRKEGTTREQFSTYWHDVHHKLVMSLDIAKKNVLRWEQTHADEKYTHAAENMGLTVADWDGILLLDGASYEDLFAIFASEEYQRVVAPDEANFLERDKCQLLPVGLVTIRE